MTRDEIVEVVEKLVGTTYPLGDSGHDIIVLEHITLMLNVVDNLICDVGANVISGNPNFASVEECQTKMVDMFNTIKEHMNEYIDEIEEGDQINKKETIPEALSGTCFHGEVWVECPHCMSGNEMMGKQALYKQDGYKIYKCNKCGKLFKDR